MNETLLILALAAGFIIIAAAAYTLYSVIINMGPSLFFKKLWHVTLPVSYTHLDVYKRQTKRYRSNLINWGMAPFTVSIEDAELFEPDDFIYIPGIRDAILSKAEKVDAYVLKGQAVKISLNIPAMTEDERDILVSGGLINYYSSK